MTKSELPEDPTAYKYQSYWEERYSKEEGESFDWFLKFDSLSSLFKEEIPNQNASILVLGCGNSTLSEDLYLKGGYKNILNIDFSETVIRQMSQKTQVTCPEMKWQVMNVQSLELPDESFDIAIDKGTMDALMCEKGDVWDPSPELLQQVKLEVDEVERVLKKGGKFIYITFGQPHFRKKLLMRDSWDLKVIQFGDCFHYYIYILTKKE